MEQRKRRKSLQILGVLGALWMIMACLMGCGANLESGPSQPAESKEVSETAIMSETAGTDTTEEATATEAKTTAVKTETADETLTEETGTKSTAHSDQETELLVEESGVYTSKEEVALYIHLYGHLPDNYITKREAENLGWNSREGNLWQVAPNMSIGGSRFGNYEGALPDKDGRKYYECDIDFDGGYRGTKRIIYSDDGLIFYTEDHYKSFEQLYGE